MRIILIYPPPWQIASPGDEETDYPYAPPQDATEHAILEDGDFRTLPYGVLTIAAEAMRAGHEVEVFNLANSCWREVEALLLKSGADLYGISAFTANRRGMGAVCALIRHHFPQAHIVVGGPFVTALPQETMRYFKAVDTVVIGEGEETFMELIARLGTGEAVTGLPGTAWREGERIVFGPMRPPIKDLDVLASPFDYFTHDIVLTSRGCPGKCTFCGSSTIWGKALRFHSVDYVLDTFRKALARLPLPFLLIKDDTFMAHRRRLHEICDRIIESRMHFYWSCDSRVDSITDELLYKMRLAGCVRISFGVESGSSKILETIHKRITPEKVLEATRLAQKYGIHVRFYMMIGNRGETPETIQQSIDLIKSARPNSYLFCGLSFYPGTGEWEILQEKQGVTPDIFFTRDFRELSVSLCRSDEMNEVLLYIYCAIGKIQGFDYTVAELESVAERLPDTAIVQVELANGYLRSGRLEEAETALKRAEALGFPMESILCNQRACIAMARNDVDTALDWLETACQRAHQHFVSNNLETLRAWVRTPPDSRGTRPRLDASIWFHAP